MSHIAVYQQHRVVEFHRDAHRQIDRGKGLALRRQCTGHHHQIAVFDFHPSRQDFSLAWSLGIEADALKPFLCGAGMFGRAVQQGMSQFQERQPEAVLLPFERNLTACVILKCSREIVGVIAIFGLLPQKNGLEWSDYELFKFLETYAAVAIQYQRLQGRQVSP